jgi:hypothetical protein
VLGEHACERVFRQHGLDRLIPEQFAGVAIEADQMSPQARLVAHVVAFHAITGPAGDQHAVADHDGAR